MADFFASTWNEDDDLNTALAPNGMPSGTQASHLYGITRNLMGASVRNARMSSPYETTTGTQPAYVITYDKFLGLNQYQRISFKVHSANAGGAATLNINSTGAKPIVSPTGLALTANQLVAGQIVDVVYNGTSFVMVNAVGDAITAGTQQRLSNKELVDSTVFFVDQTDVTKKIAFDAAGITTATTRTYTGPNASGTLVLDTATQTLTNKTISGGTLSGTIAGSPTLTGTPTISANTATTFTGYQFWQPTDYAVGKPRLAVTKYATATDWELGLYDTVNNAGSINLSASSVKKNNVEIVDVSTAQTLTNKTISGGTISGTIAGTATYSQLQTIAVGTATTQAEYLQLRPTNFATGSPYLTFQKLATANQWAIGLWDGTNNSGLINISASSVQANGVTVADISTAQTFTNKTLTSPTLTTPTINQGTINTPTLTVNDASFTIQDNTDTTKKVVFEASGITTATTRTLTVPNVNGTIATINNAQTFTGVQTFTNGFTAGSSTINGALTLTPAGNASIEIGRIDGTASTPFIDFHAGATAVDYDGRIIMNTGTGVAGGGQMNIIAGTLLWNGNSLVDAASTQTIGGAKTFSSSTTHSAGLQSNGIVNVTNGTSVSGNVFFNAQPSDFGISKPGLRLVKDPTATKWNFQTWDGSSSAGTIHFDTTNLTTGVSAWQIYHRGNTVGTVVNNGGTPGGAIIETGGSYGGNNSYVRFADGTQICYGFRQLSYATASRVDNTITFGAAFATTGYVVNLTLRPNTNAGAVTTVASNCTPGARDLGALTWGASTATTCTGALYSISGGGSFVAGDFVYVDYVAYGRWY